MKPEVQNAWREVARIKNLVMCEHFTYDSGRERAKPHLATINNRAVEIAREFGGRPPLPLTWAKVNRMTLTQYLV